MADTGAGNQNQPVRARTLEYKQAMKDFHVMFPTIERDIIECVLRSNAGHVDSTIDQLLQLSQDMTNGNRDTRNHLYELYYRESSSSTESIPSELRGPPTSSEDDQPPRYTPTEEPPPSPYAFAAHPIEPFSQKRFRDWNPPLLGTLPDDFLRIVSVKSNISNTQISPQQKNRSKAASSSKTHLRLSRSQQSGVHAGYGTPAQPVSKSRLQRRKTTGQADSSLRPSQSLHDSPQRRMVRVDAPQSRISHSDHHNRHHIPHRRSSVPVSRSRQRSSDEQSQYIEDRRVALMLQNEEFLRELRRNEHFLHELNKGEGPENNHKVQSVNPREEFKPISVNPVEELAPASTEKQNTENDSAGEEKEFKESLKHMNKSSKKSFMELARKFNARRKSYKAMNDTLDPVFARCSDDQRR